MTAWGEGTGITADESRVPYREPFTRLESDAQAPSTVEPYEALRARVEAREEELWLTSSDSKFHARWALQGASPSAKAAVGVVLIPGHPTYAMEGQLGGDSMDSRLMLTLADTLQKAGFPTIRFDYRGVGRSPGTFDAVCCVRDLVAATSILCGASGRTGPCAQSVMVGYSFGAASAVGNIYLKGCKKFVSISHGTGFGETMPDGWARKGGQLCRPESAVLRKLYNRTAIFFTTLRLTIPKLWLVGGDDVLTPASEVGTWVEKYSPGRGRLSTMHTVRGVRHDWQGHEADCARLLLAWLQGPANEIVYDMDFASGKVQYTHD